MTKKYESVADFAAFRQLRDDIARGFDQVAERVQQPGGNDSPGDLSGVFGKGLENFFSQVADGLRTAGDAVDEQTAAYSSETSGKRVEKRSVRAWPESSDVAEPVQSESGSANRFTSSASNDQHASSNVIEPLLDCCETESAYLLMFDIPGVDPAAVDLEVKGQLLTLSGVNPVVPDLDGISNKDAIREALDTTRQRSSDVNVFNKAERAVGKFSRTITLPADADCEAIVAESYHGVLTITVAKAVSRQSRKITINPVD